MSGIPPLRPSDRQLITTLGRYGELRRDQVTRLSGLPRSTVTDAVARLLRRGVVMERTAPVTASARMAGRPPKVLTLAAPTGVMAVIALTHQTLQAGVVGFDGTLHTQHIIDPYVQGTSQGLTEPGLALLGHALGDASCATSDLGGLVVGMPRPVAHDADPARRKPGHEPSRPGHATMSIADPGLPADPAAEFGRRLGVPAWTENDANLGALGEGAYGAATDMATFIYIKIAHGIGAGLVLDRRLHWGFRGLAGELAHIHVEEGGSLCRCGGRGCLMTTLNTPRLIDWIQTVHPSVTTMADLISLATAGDASVWRLLRDLGRTLGRSLADFCVYVAPDGIVLDGILQAASAPVISGIEEMLYEFAPPEIARHVRVAGGLLGNRAELQGAAVLARQHRLGHDVVQLSPAGQAVTQ